MFQVIKSVVTSLTEFVGEVKHEVKPHLERAKAVFVASQRLQSDLMFVFPIGTSPAGYPIYKVDSLITCSCGLLPSEPGALAVLGLDGKESIFINSAAKDLPAAYEAMIAHEEAHHVLGHLKAQKDKGHSAVRGFVSRALGGENNEYVRREFEADAYSAAQGYDMIACLQALPQNKEIRERIKRLK